MPSPYLLNQLSDTDALARQLLTEYPQARTWFLEGTLGAGKTTLVQAFCRALGVEEVVQSPTYALVHEYVTLNGPVHHLDLYRLTGKEDEALDMGLDYYLNESPYYCFVEWGSIVPTLWPERYLLLTLEVLPNAARQVSLTPNP